MKKILFILIMLCVCANVNSQSFKMVNNTYTSVSSKTKVEGKKTPYQYEARDGQKYDIYILPDGRCYTNRVSGTTGKQYRSYLKEEISKDICAKVGVKYTYVKKSKKKQ